MKIEKTIITYNFKELKQSILEVIDNEKAAGQLVNFIKKEIMYGAFSTRDPFQNHNFDWVISKEFINILTKELGNKDKLFSNKASKVIKEKNVIAITVDEDNDTYEEYPKNNIDLREGVEIQLYPTFPIFDKYMEKAEELFKKEKGFKDRKWTILEKIESFDRKYKEKYLKHSDYQFGGNMVFSTQGEYNNFLGSYFGEYGDAGSVYAYVCGEYICSTVDMH